MKRIDWIILAVALVVSVLLYGNTLHGAFIYDDTLVVTRPELRNPAYLPKLLTEPYIPRNRSAGAYRPLTVLSYAVNDMVLGGTPEGFHAVNIFLNGMAVFLVYAIVFLLFGKRRLAILSALIFAVLPVHTEAVASIKSRDEVLSGVLVLVSWSFFLLSLRDDSRRLRYMFLSSLSFCLGLFAKEHVLLAPAAFVATASLIPRWSGKSLWRRLLWYVPGMIPYFLLRQIALGPYAYGTDVTDIANNPLLLASFETRIWSAFKIITLAIEKTVFPLKLSATYAYNNFHLVAHPFASWETLAGIGIVSASVLTVRPAFRKSIWGVGLVIFVITYAMMSKFFLRTAGPFAERWMYVPSLGIVLILAGVVDRIWSWRRAAGIGALVVILGLYGVRTVTRNQIWLTRKGFFETMIADAPESVHGYTNLAKYYIEEEKNFTLAAPLVARGMGIYDRYVPLLGVAGVLAIHDGRYLDAIRYADTAIALHPEETGSYVVRTIGLVKLGRYADALEVLEKDLAEEQYKPQVRFLLALTLTRLGRAGEAREYYDWDATRTMEETKAMIDSF